MMEPVIHHVQLCVRDTDKTFHSLKKYGFNKFAVKENGSSKQLAIKLNNIIFILSEYVDYSQKSEKMFICDAFSGLCSRCKDHNGEVSHVDTVNNVCICVKSVKNFFLRATEKIDDFQKFVIQPPTIFEDEHGQIEYAVIRSACENVCHTLVNKDGYRGGFLPGFEILKNEEICDYSEIAEINKSITQIDHVTLACYKGYSDSIIAFYQNSFCMEKFSISSKDDNEGLIIKDGIGLRLRALQHWKCAETGLMCPSTELSQGERAPNSFMLVVVESLTGQTDCNVETYLREHGGCGIEHIAFATTNIVKTVSKMSDMGVKFRLPPEAYYNELKQMPKINAIQDIDLEEIAKLGILLDREDDDTIHEQSILPKYLMQIFSMHLFQEKTFFIELIQRKNKAVGLGAGNIIALVRSIRGQREYEKRKAAEERKCSTKDAPISRQVC